MVIINWMQGSYHEILQVISGPKNPPKFCLPLLLVHLNRHTNVHSNVLSSSEGTATSYLALTQTLANNVPRH